MELSEIIKNHEMNEGQEKLLSLMQRFDNLCRKHGIKYFLGGGSALGAVRHRGFLPWDDDVDLYIPRKEYDKVYALKDEFFSDEFVLVCNEEFNTYRNTLVRCIDTNSTAITRARIVDDAPKGQFIELFILDPMPMRESEQKLWLKKHWIYAELLCTTFRVANERIEEWLDWDLYKTYRKRCDAEGKEKVIKELHDELFTIEEKDAKQYCVRWGLRNLIYDIEWFNEQRYVPFENTLLPVALKAEDVLRFDYGDSWMYIPLQEEQIVHAITSSMTIPYKYFMDDYLQFIDPKDVLENYAPRKEATVSWFEQKVNRVKKTQKLKKVAIEMEMRRISKQKIDTLLQANDFAELARIYENWTNEQSGTTFWPYKEFLDIEDDYLYAALIPQLKMGKYSFVLKVIEWRKKRGYSLSDNLVELNRFAENIRNAYRKVDYRQWDEVPKQLLEKEFGEQLTEKSVLNVISSRKENELSWNQYDYEYLLLLTLVKNEKKQSIEKIMNAVDSSLKSFPDKGELLALKAELYMSINDYEKAVYFYAEAFEKTRNGLVRLCIKDSLDKMGVK